MFGRDRKKVTEQQNTLREQNRGFTCNTVCNRLVVVVDSIDEPALHGAFDGNLPGTDPSFWPVLL